MLSVFFLSLGATFASDNATDVIATDESSIDESIAVDKDSSTLSGDESVTVTKDNFNVYFDDDGKLYDNVTANEIKFSGEISNISTNNILIDRAINITSDSAVFKNISFNITSSDVIIDGITIQESAATFAIAVSAADVTIQNTDISFYAMQDFEGYAIYADSAANLNLIDNVIYYVGASPSGYTFYTNNAIRISNSSNAIIARNKINASLVSLPVSWSEVPAGSGNWVSNPVSEGIVIINSYAPSFNVNEVYVSYSSYSGQSDTIYSVDINNCSNAAIINNIIVSTGKNYIYGLILSGDDFTIKENNITSNGEYYVNGIDIEGPAYGVVENNVITVNSNSSAYAIYSGMNGQNVTANYTGNNISGNSYAIFGFSLGDVEASLINNSINIEGNYTTGIAYSGSNITIKGNRIILTSSETGDEYIYDSFGVETVGIKIYNGITLIENNTIASAGKGIYIYGESTIATIKTNFVNVVANFDKSAYAILAVAVNNLTISDNNIDYQGTTNGTGINNAVYIYYANTVLIEENDFSLELISIDVPWIESPAGSGNWVSYPISEGIVVVDSTDVDFIGNNVTVTLGGSTGDYNTIYSVDFKNSNNTNVINNNITSNGDTYIYGIIIDSQNFTIKANTIVSNGNYYANGVDVEGESYGLIQGNTIIANANTSSYPIYGGMTGLVSVVIKDNEISGNAYLVNGIQIGGDNVTVENNNITATGNYTKGIAAKVNQILIKDNNISSSASNVGNLTIVDEMGTDTEGILIKSGDARIVNNIVNTTGEYAINAGDNTVLLKGNTLTADNASGEDAVGGTYVNYLVEATAIKTIIVGSDLTKAYGSDDQYVLIVLDENGNPIVGKNITVSINNQTLQATTDSDGVAKFDIDLDVGNYTIEASFAGNVVYASKNITNTVVVTTRATAFTASSTTVLLTAVKSGSYYKIILKDTLGNVLASKKVTVTFNGKTTELTTDSNGAISYKLAASKAGSYKMTLKFAGDTNYAASSAIPVIKITKEATKLSAAKKTFKAKTKTKKYAVTLKNSKGKAIKGLKVTITVKGKTYKATTNAKGKAVLKITKLTKKGSYTAKVKFAGNTYYNGVSKSVKLTIK